MSQLSALRDLLQREGSALEKFVRRHGGGLLRYESLEDLVQGVSLLALKSESGFEYRGDGAFNVWLQQVARRFLASRHAYWTARKRDAGRLLRVTSSDSSRISGTDSVNPRGGESPSRMSIQREELALAARAIALLLPRDQEIIRLVAEESSVEAIADALDMTTDTARKARLRAIQRFRKTLELLESSAWRSAGAK
ncbi:MAG: RNA polymerase sigma factor [Planctomycetota bacterium]